MTISQLISPLVAITLVVMMMSVGLAVPASQLLAITKKPWLVVRALLANYLFFPLVAVLLLALFHAKPMVQIGFLTLAVCPGAPYAPSCTSLAKGNVPLSVGLMVILAGSSVVISPLLLHELIFKLGGEAGRVSIDSGRIVRTLLATQLAPLFLGLLTRHWRPRLAGRLEKPFALAMKLLTPLVMVLVIATQFQTLVQIKLVGLLGMLLLLASGLLVGWLAGGPGIENRKAVAEVTSLRNAGVALVIASTSFAGTPALSAVVIYALVSIIGSFVVALIWGRRALVRARAH
jgi:BASS family bile acid:Na+ symporter